MNIISQLGKGRKRWLFAALDVILPFLVILVVDLIAVPFSELGSFISERWYVMLIQIAVYPIVFFIFRIYRISWVYCNAWECVRLCAVSRSPILRSAATIPIPKRALPICGTSPR
ncbi:MAG: hypothetical protein IKP55_06735 [Clostridia bacterium]|nr:hypothetical protein [Clostridia bacterium]